MNNKRAFTLVELLIVLLIVGVLIGIAVPAVQRNLPVAKQTAFRENVKQIVDALETYRSQIIYAGTGNGIYKSTNGGSSWTKTSTTSSIYSLAVDPTDPRIVYAGTANGVYKSIDGGNTLTQFFPGRSIGYLIIDPTNPQILYVSTIDTYDNNIFKTINQLTSIGKCNLDLDHTYRANALAINPNNPRIIYAGTNNGLYKTKNGCEKWVYIDLLGGIINSLAISSNNPEILYVGTDTGVYKVY